MSTHIVTKTSGEIGLEKRIFDDPTPMLKSKSVAREFKLNYKIGVLVNLTSLCESNGVFIIYHIYR